MAVDLNGLVVPVATPFTDADGVDGAALRRHLVWMAERGVTRVMINGTTAEFFSLLPAERRDLLAISRDAFDGTLVFNTGSDSLAQACEAARWAETLGADAIVAMTPYYLANVGEEGITRFLLELEAATELPMVIYNFTKHTGNAITPAILKRVPHVAVKDSSGDTSLIGATPLYLGGTSRKMVQAWQAGAHGFVSALANVLPERYVALEACLAAGDIEAAEAEQSAISASLAPPPAGTSEIAFIKQHLAALLPGYHPRVRLPLLAACTQASKEGQ